MMTYEEAISFDALWDAYKKCCRSVAWKNSTKSWMAHPVENIWKLHQELANGTYKPRKPEVIHIYYPKHRDAMSIKFRDRVYQRSINDNILYPEMTKHFIIDNCACQKGKGTKFARDRIKKHLHNYYINHGFDGYILQLDIHGYYPNMCRQDILDCFAKYIPMDIVDKIATILDSQEINGGYNPGSQMLQIAGISLLNPLDHYIKERLKVKHYIRYQDDFWMIIETKEDAELIMKIVEKKLSFLGLELNQKKSKIIPLSGKFEMLGHDWWLTKTGKVMMVPTKQNIKHERRKIVRMARKGVSPNKSKLSLDCWVAHANEGKCARNAIKNTIKLWEEVNNAQIQSKTSPAEGRGTT